ncbi:uncharacterized protein K444DRAFT_660198 [Hyaloscypha bicolor E]|uniref:Uncharacterized protein n=1 Tax=Hyaloscypha bicolor E TaxID=1095630 RepID=A0A2J6TPU1_9HELO|nr:uncharacterized protein K444DRAFT_660198 [Hyaloscypha bicolor E]PMD65041.1 hypothetical protein K444DRAFT_660198 [Hyaloscypha bicolor E]
MTERTSEQIHHHASFLRQCTADFATEIASHPSDESTNSFLITIKSFMIALNGSFSQYHDPIAFIEADLHHIWYMVISVAKISSPEDTTHDSLVLLLLYFRELGTLRRRIEGVEEEEKVGGERVWTDLPYFAEDLLAEWRNEEGLTAKQRINLAVFIGKCVAFGVDGANSLLSALWLLREALEGGGELDAPKRDGGVPFVELLSACAAIFENCGHKILTLCFDSQTLGQGNLKFSDSDQVPARELSIARWLSWRQTFQDLSRNEDEALAKGAKLGFNVMISCGREMGCDVEGEEKYWAKVMKLLEEELKRSGKESVGLEDIVTDPSWVD